MRNEKIIRERFKVFEKLTKVGYDTDKKIIDLNIEELVQLPNFNRSELTIAIGIKKALSSKMLVAFLCGLDTENKL